MDLLQLEWGITDFSAVPMECHFSDGLPLDGQLAQTNVAVK